MLTLRKADGAQITRRSLLLGLVAIGITPKGALAVAASPGKVARRLEAEMKVEPMRFAVSRGGTIELVNYLPRRDRYAAYDVSPKELRSDAGVADLIPRIQPLRIAIYWYSQDLLGEENGLQDYDAELVQGFFVGLSGRRRLALRRHLKAWFAEDVPSDELEDPDIVAPVDGRTIAFRLFGELFQQDLSNSLRIQIVEGEHPSSSYYAAELGVAVEEANGIVAKRGLNWVFESSTC